MPKTSAPHEFLPGIELTLHDRSIHLNWSVWSSLSRIKPDVVITSGFNPTHLVAFAWARWNSAKHVPMTDGTLESESCLSGLHRFVRRFVFKRSHAFLAASDSGLRIYDNYGVSKTIQFKSCLAVESSFSNAPSGAKQFDLMFCGRFEPVKGPEFALDVAHELAHRIHRRVSILMVGSGSLDETLRRRAEKIRQMVDVTFSGFVQRDTLPELYRKCRVMLVPSTWEPWGLVVNEAIGCGLFVVASNHVGAARELLSKQNGLILNLDPRIWVEKIADLLGGNYDVDPAPNGERLRQYTFAAAADGIVAAAKAAVEKRVVIFQRRLPHYRVEFFDALRDRLSASGISIALIHGDPHANEKSKKDTGTVAWANKVGTTYLGPLCIQHLPDGTLDADLIICPHESSYLLSHRILFSHRRAKFAYWGHGRNMKAHANVLSEYIKRRFASRADWWFAYTDLSLAYLREADVGMDRVTVVNNAVASTGRDSNEARGTAPTAVYIGSLYAEKRIPFLLEACELIAQEIPEFQLHIIGAGPDQKHVEAAAVAHPWLTFHGSLTGERKASVLRHSQLLVCPGLVGLNIVDGFTVGLPLITTEDRNHSPEIVYLEHGVNGLMTADNVGAYSRAVIDLLKNRSRLRAMQFEASRAANLYTLENMVERFASGIMRCLEREKRRA